MLDKIYAIPKMILVSFLIGMGIFVIILLDPPHTMCDTQIQHFKSIQGGKLYKDSKDFHKEKTSLKRQKNLCQKEQAPGACYEYFASLRQLLTDFHVISKDCADLIFISVEVKQAFSEALTLMVFLSWREEVLRGQVSKYNWLARTDISLFCDVKKKYIMSQGKESYHKLEKKILDLLPHKQKISRKFLIRRTILSEACSLY